MPRRSALRQDHADAAHARIVEAALTVIERGEEPTMRAVARAADIAERTLYRYYATREELAAAAMPAIRARASAPMADDAAGLEDYVRRLYSTFDRNAQLTRALVHARWAPTNKTRTMNLRALRQVLDAAYPDAPESDRSSAAAGLRVPLSAAGWVYLADCGLGLEASVAHVQWLVRAVLAALEGSKRKRGARHA